jgi:hypothetical protein
MIYQDSRYVEGTVVTAQDARTQDYQVAVFRNFPEDIKNFVTYTWKERDRLDILAYTVFGSSSLWWRIMDFNPELGNGFNIPVGTVIRIPIG